MVHPSLDLERLAVGERLQLIEQLSDSLRQRAGVLGLSEDQRTVIEASRAEHRVDRLWRLSGNPCARIF